jgi:hypothetical protein
LNNNKSNRNSGRPPHEQHPTDWKQLAKSSSRFSTTVGTILVY